MKESQLSFLQVLVHWLLRGPQLNLSSLNVNNLKLNAAFDCRRGIIQELCQTSTQLIQNPLKKGKKCSHMICNFCSHPRRNLPLEKIRVTTARPLFQQEVTAPLVLKLQMQKCHDYIILLSIPFVSIYL